MIAQKPPANLERMDGQLAGLNQQLAKSASVLDELASIQLQFEDLAQTYADFKAYAQRLQSEGGAGIASLRRETEQRFQSMEKSLQDAQHRSTGEEGEEAREAVQIQIENLESRLRQELRGALNRIDQAGFSPVQLEKLEKLDIQMRGMRNALRSSERRERMLQNGLVAVAIMALMALGMPLLMPLILGDDKSSAALLQNRSASGRPANVTPLKARPLSESVDPDFDGFAFSGNSSVSGYRNRP